MNKELFQSMQKQMTPSPEVRAALSEKLAQPVKRRTPVHKYVAAACAALVIGAFPLYQAINPRQENLIPALHSYVTVEGLTGYSENVFVGSMETGSSGDQDMDMTIYDLEQTMLDAGFTPDEVKEYQSVGYQMTWAKWWKFVHQQENSGGSEPFSLSALKDFSQQELYVNTGALPAPNTGGLSDAAARYEELEAKAIAQLDAINAYQKLMGHFYFGYPNWYGGAYIDDNNNLMVLLVSSKDPGDKSSRVLRWTGSDKVVFGSAKYSLQELLDLQDKVCDAMMKLGLFSGCGTDESDNQLHLTLTSVTDEALAILARLDPEDDAIYVEVGQLATTNDLASEAPAVQHVMPGGATIPEDDGGLIAYEPYYDGAKYDLEHLPEELPESKQPAIQIQSVPEEDASPRTEDASTASYEPNR